ncbi:MAG: hypothetical protein ACR2NN_07860 [Bryobacteraceae bacterium]
MRGLCWFFVAAGVAFAQPAIESPQIGWITSSGQLRPVIGLAANFVVGESIGDRVVSSSFSGSFGLVKTDSSVLVLDRAAQVLFQTDADPGPALFAFATDGSPAFVYLAQTKSLLSWKSDHLETTAFELDGTVLAIGNRDVIVKRDGGLWRVDLADGTQTPIPGVEGPVLPLSDGSLLYSDSQSFVLRQPDGTERRIDGAVPAAAFEQMGKDWVHVTEQDSTRQFAIRLELGREQLFQLPESAQ